MAPKSRYELVLELKALIQETGIPINIAKLTKPQIQEEINVRKIVIKNRVMTNERGKRGPVGPREVRFEVNEEGINTPVGLVERPTKPKSGRGRGRPPNVKPAPEKVSEEIQTPSLPPSLPSLAVSERVETLGASNESDESKISFTMLKCTCLTCPAHSGYRRL
jgi:hypothetical protein